VSAPDWHLMKRIGRLLATDDGQTIDEIAERLGVTTTQARTAALIMVRRGRAALCDGRVCAVPPRQERRSA